MSHKVCPWWIGYILIIPFRKRVQDPLQILSPFVQPGMTILEIGPGMGFFTLTLANLVGKTGRVVCVDVQPKMLDKLRKRASNAGLQDRIELRVCPANSLGIEDLTNQVDFVLAFAVVHEVPKPEALFKEVFKALKPGAKLLLAEPSGHVRQPDFVKTEQLTREQGFEEIERPQVWKSLSVLLRKPL